MFFFKRKKIVLDCFVAAEHFALQYPIDNSAKYLPKWWKTLPRNYEDFVKELNATRPVSTMRNCYGFIELYKRSLTIPLWADVRIYTTKSPPSYRYVSPSDMFSVITHSSKQYNNAFRDYMHMKFESPWVLKEKTGVKFLMTGCSWSLMDSNPGLQVMTGVLPFNTQTVSNINVMVPVADNQIDIKAGTPLCFLIPLTEKKVVTKMHVVTIPELQKLKATYLNTSTSGKFLRIMNKLEREK